MAETDFQGRTAAEEPLRAALQLLPVGLLSLDRDGTVLLAEGALFARLGLDPARMVGRPLADEAERLGWVRKAAQQALGGREVRAVGESPLGGRFELRFHPVLIEGNVAWAVGALHEVADPRREEDLREERRIRRAAEAVARRAEFLSEASRKLNASLDFETTIQTISRVAIPEFTDGCVVFLLEGGRLKQVTAAHTDPEIERELHVMFERYPPDPNAPVGMGGVVQSGGNSLLYAQVGDELLRGLARSEEHLQMLRDMRMKSYLVVPLLAHGAVLGVLAFATLERVFDRQDLKLAEELGRRCAAAVENARLYREMQKALQLREDFLGIASHELRTPLTPLKILLEALEARLRKSGGDPLPLVQRARRSVDRLAALENDLLDVVQLEAGRLTLHSEPFSLRDELGDLVSDFRETEGPLSLGAAPPRAGREGERRQGPDRAGDHEPARQRGEVQPGGRRDPGRAVGRGKARRCLEVVDHGIGIPLDQQGRIFERFFRATTSPIERYGGLGLGLYISKEIVERHGGRIWLTSEPGKGATFYVALPLAP